jgi:hypothetical protein
MYAGWHFSADGEGCRSLLDLFEILSNASFPAHRTVTIADPQIVGVDRIFGEHALRLDVPAKLRLGNDPSGTAGTSSFSDGAFSMTLRPEDLAEFSRAVADVSVDHADFGVGFGADDLVVRFWWWPKGR